MDELGKTVVVVLHDINFASCNSDHVVAMRDGKVIHRGSPEAMIRPDVLAEIYDLDITVEEIGGKRIGVYCA